MGRKGQALTVEETLFMGLGLLLILGTFTAFYGLSQTVAEDIEAETSSGVLEYVAANIEGLRKAGEGYVEIKMIPHINRQGYLLVGRGAKVLHLTRTNGELIDERSMTVDVVGQADSASDVLRLEYRDGTVFMRGVSY